MTANLPRFWRAAATAALIVLFPSMALAEERIGSGADTSGDQTNPQRDIVALSARYDTSGVVSVTTTFREAPTAAANAFAYVTLGTLSGTKCGEPFVLAGHFTDPAVTDALAVSSEAPQTFLTATKVVNTNTITVSATTPTLAGKGYNCATSGVNERSPGTTIFDSTDAPTALAVPVPPPPPPPTAPVVLTRDQKLAKALKTCRAKKPLAARRRCEAKTRAKFAPPLTQAQKLTKAVKACRASYRGARRVRCIATARTRYGPPKAAPLGGRTFYYPGVDVSFVCGGTCWKGYTFIDDKWAHKGLTEDDGLFPRCTQRAIDKNGEGCVPYSYNPTTNSGVLDGKPFTLVDNATDLKIGGDDLTYFGASTVKTGARFGFILKAVTVYGFPYSGQTVTQRWLEVAPDGRFILSAVILGGAGDPSGVETRFSAVPADQKGRYEFLPGGVLRLSYESGTVQNLSAFILAGKGGADPGVAGMYIGGIMYFKEA